MNNVPEIGSSGNREASKLEHALTLARDGFYVFPLEPNAKTPAITAWQKKATRDTEQIKRWWTDPVMATELDRNIGIFTGKFDTPGGDCGALIVIDVDVKTDRNGEDTLTKLQAGGWTLPPTLTARTASGGKHLIYGVDRPRKQGGANVLGPGLDVRSHGGYIVAPGSSINGKCYQFADEAQRDIATAPQCVIDKLDKLGAPREPEAAPVTPIQPFAFKSERAREATLVWAHDEISKMAEVPEGGEGENDGRHMTLIKTLMTFNETGLSYADLLDCAHRINSEKCIPPFTIAEVEYKTSNVERTKRYKKGSRLIADADFEPIPEAEISTPQSETTTNKVQLDPKPAHPPLDIKPDPLRDPADIPPRRWIVGGHLVGGKVSFMVAPPGVGKSIWSMQMALAVATGRSDLLDLPVRERGNVMLINNEDDTDELDMRRAAIMAAFNISNDDIRGKYFPYSGEDRPFMIAKTTSGGLIKPYDKDTLIQKIRDNNILLLIVDPLIETHDVPENENNDLAQVARMYRDIAVKTRCAVLVIHHTRKHPAGSSDSHVGNMDSSRGGGAVMGVARITHTLYGMSKKDAKTYGIPDDQRKWYVRKDDAKSNLSMITHQAKWFRKESVKLPNGEDLGVLRPVELTTVQEGAASAAEQDLFNLLESIEVKQSVRDRAKELNLSDAKVNRLIKKAEADDLISKKAGKGAPIEYALTPKGREKLADVFPDEGGTD